jgi:hypothetical protein
VADLDLSRAPVDLPIGKIAAITSAATLTPDADALGHQGTHRVDTLTHSPALAVPTGGVDGQQVALEWTASAATRTVTINASILLTTGITNTVAIATGKCWFAILRRKGTVWRIVASQVET